MARKFVKLFVMIAALAFISTPAFAAWTITQTVDERVSIKSQIGDKIVVVKLACVVDGSSSGTVAIQSDILREIQGSWLYMIKLVPGSADVDFEFDVLDKNGDALLDTAANTFAATSFIKGYATLGIWPPILHYCGVIIDGTGAITDTKTLDIYIYFVK